MAKKIKFKYSKKLISNSLTYKLSITLDIMLTVFTVVLITLYTIGNYQNFQDKSQQIILSLLSYTSVFNALLSLTLSVETIIKLITEKRKVSNVFNLIYLILAIVISVGMIVFSNIISYLAMGI